MDKPIPTLAFQSMKLSYKARDFLKPRQIILSEVPIKLGDTVLDFGCGPGSYTFIIAKIVGSSGRVVALDIHPLAIKHVENLIASRGISNVTTVLSDCDTGCAEETVDVILLFDIFHMFEDPNKILRELHRVIKPVGLLSFIDQHMSESSIINGMIQSGLFELQGRAEFTFSFRKKP
ncbi:class I SAM-dependent methyltransferase [candidate division KSB1 bacterium]|nr:class I SAM-dependent methyltransferase [candidate division KSB1 bacterium]